jgi:hypothetical protein
MSDSTISLKPINDLLTDERGMPNRFWIPAYQRGYRWSPLQVSQLLDDVWDFIQASDGRKKDEFYCLQPLVIKTRPGGSFEVVDGQQRLTTILFILSYLNQRFSADFRRTLYAIGFETRRGFDDFLANPTEEKSLQNVDFFHIFEGIKQIRRWFSKKSNFVNDIESALLNRTKVIWFELSDGDNSVDAFTRLNVGKIPLTNDELIRALFLKRTRADESEAEALQLRIAYEWDQLEKALQSDAFWYFLNNQEGKTQNRIGFLFDLVARSEELPEGAEHDPYRIFYAYSERLKNGEANSKEEWLKIKKAYMTLEEWFDDRVLYHIIGFLISEGVEISALKSLSEQSNKSDFERKLRGQVFARMIGGDMPDGVDNEAVRNSVRSTLAGLEYGSDRPKIKSFLLLFNLATLLQNQRSNLRFQFDSFKSERWDIEHVRSVTSDKPERHSDRVRWLKHCLGYLRSQKAKEDLQAEIDDFIKLPQKEALDSLFEPLYGRLLEYFEEGKEEEADHGIANLTLLDQSTNRSYKNAVFAVKRQCLLSLDQTGIFVPLCTRNVFLKCYSPQVDNVMFWGSVDRESYQSAILETLVGFFTGKMETAV